MARTTSSQTHRSQRRPASSQTSQTSSAPPPPLAETYMDSFPPDILNAPLLRYVPLPSDPECDEAQARALANGAQYGAYAQPQNGHHHRSTNLIAHPQVVYASNGQPFLYAQGATPEQLYNFRQRDAFTDGQQMFVIYPAPAGQYNAAIYPPSSTLQQQQQQQHHYPQQPQQYPGQIVIPIAAPKPVHGSPNSSPLTPAPSPSPPSASHTAPISGTSSRRSNPTNELRVRRDPAHRHATPPET